jgi:hypothetical protein
MKEEEWRDTLDKNVQVSNLGNIKTLYVRGSRKKTLLKEYRDAHKSFHKDTGYQSVSVGGSNKIFLVHRLIATIFIPNPGNKPQINHINGIKTDNRVCNLEWVTRSENCIHSFKLGLNVSPMKNKKMSEKHKEKISIANKGKIKSLEWMENIAKAKAEKIVKWFEHTWYFSSIEEANAFKKYWNI